MADELAAAGIAVIACGLLRPMCAVLTMAAGSESRGVKENEHVDEREQD